MPRVLVALLVVLALPGAGVAVAQTDTTSTTPTTVTTPEDVGTDFGDEDAPAEDTSPVAEAAPAPLPVTGWRGRYALALGVALLGAGLGLRRLTH